jgi:hypothetical protein
MKIKAVSLWEPWASLIRTGAKTYETRSWATSYRGSLLICAAKKKDPEAMNIYLQLSDFQIALAPLLKGKFDIRENRVNQEHLNFGKAVAIVNLVDCIPTEKIGGLIRYGDCFGNYANGRFAWKLETVNNSFEPFPVKGGQGLFDVEVQT